MNESLLHVCPSCRQYTFQATCPKGHGATRSPHPARYSPQDRWARYRRALYGAPAPAAGGP